MAYSAIRFGTAGYTLPLGDAQTASNPQIAFRSGGAGAAYDARFIAGGGSATPGTGYLNFYGSFLQIVHDTIPLDYTPTRASFVVQHRDAAPITTDYASVPGVVYQFNTTGNANIAGSGAASVSKGFHQGVFSNHTKTGDGSAHSFTGAGTIGAVGPGGYNEIGAFVGTSTNIGSTNGLVAFIEGVIKDGPDAATHYDTRMYWGAVRVNRQHAGTRSVVGLQFSSEGTADVDALIAGTNGQGGGNWKQGLNLGTFVFTSGVAMTLPNATTLNWLDAGGATQAVVGVSAGNQAFMQAAASAGAVQARAHDGTVMLSSTAAFGTVALNVIGASGAATAQVKTTVTGAAADTKNSDILSTATGTTFRLLDDAQTAFTNWLGVVRNGTTAISITASAAKITLSGATSFGVVSKAGSPTVADLASGMAGVFKDTSAGTVRLVVNDGGTLLALALTTL